MSVQSAFPFAVLAVGLGIALHSLRDVDAERLHEAPPPGAAVHDPSSGDGDSRLGAVVPVALRRTVESESPHIDARIVDGRLVRADNLEAAGTRRTCRVQPSIEGIEFPDGTRLPLLNGLSEAPPVVPRQDARRLAPVIAIVVDADGWEWYEHADGARTTSRLHAVRVAGGELAELRAVSVHEAASSAGRPVEGALRSGR
jgi:hypothetical protein